MAEPNENRSPVPSGSPPSTGNLGSKVARGAAWVIAARATDRVLGFFSTAILARLLTPADFGVVAIATAIIGIGELVTSVGVDWNLLRIKDPEQSHYDSAWTLRLLLYSGVAALVLMSIPLSANYFSEPRLQVLLAILAFGTALTGLENIGIVEFRRNFRFDIEFKLIVLPRMIAIAATLVIAYRYQSYLALAVGIVTQRAVSLLMSYAMHPYRPRLAMSRFRELMGFSVWSLVNNILEALRNRLSYVFAGRSLQPHGIGVLSLAQELGQMPIQELAGPVGRAVYSAYAHREGDRAALCRDYVRVIEMLWLVATPVLLGTCVFADDIIRIVLGEQWRETALPLRILSGAAFATLLQSNAAYVFYAIGRPQMAAIYTGISTVLLLVMMPFMADRYAVLGAAVAILISSITAVPIALTLLMKNIPLRFGHLFRAGWRPLLAALLAGSLAWWIESIMQATTALESIQRLIVGGGVLVVVYALVIFVAWRSAGAPDSAEAWIVHRIRIRIAR